MSTNVYLSLYNNIKLEGYQWGIHKYLRRITTFAIGGYLFEANVEAEAGRSIGSIQQSL